MDYLTKMQKEKVHVETISLEFKLIEDMKPVVQQLRKFNILRHLSLKGNRIKSLPPQFGQLGLVSLDLQNNAFKSLQDFLPALQQMQSLESLQVNISSIEEFKAIAQRIPGLKTLNNNKLPPKIPKQVPVPPKCLISSDSLDGFDYLFDIITQRSDQSSTEIQYRAYKTFLQKTKKDLVDLNNDTEDMLVCERNIINSEFLILQHCVNYAMRSMEEQQMELFDSVNQIYNKIIFRLLGLKTSSKAASKEQRVNQELIQQNRMLFEELQSLRASYKQLQNQNTQLINKLIEKNVRVQDLPFKPEKSKKAIQPVGDTELQQMSLTERGLSLKSLKQLIEEIMQSKLKSQSQEALQNYLYSFFQQKYGLKNVVLEWAFSLAQAVKTYNSDPQVACFALALKALVDQGYYNVQKDLRAVLREMANYIIKDSKIKKRSTLSLKQLLQLVQVSFKQADESTLWGKIKRQFEGPNQDNVELQEFLDKVSLFQLQRRVDQISPLLQVYRRFGNSQQPIPLPTFFKLCRAIDSGISDAQIRALLEKGGAGKYPRLSFSTVAKVCELKSQGKRSLLRRLRQGKSDYL